MPGAQQLTGPYSGSCHAGPLQAAPLGAYTAMCHHASSVDRKANDPMAPTASHLMQSDCRVYITGTHKSCDLSGYG